MKKKYFNYQKTGAVVIGTLKEPFCHHCGFEFGLIRYHKCPINVADALNELKEERGRDENKTLMNTQQKITEFINTFHKMKVFRCRWFNIFFYWKT